MNKSKIVLASIGGVAGVATLVMAYLIWSVYSQKQTVQTELAAAESSISSLNRGVRTSSGKAKGKEQKEQELVVPCQKGINEIKAKVSAVNDWKTNALAYVKTQVHESRTIGALKLKEEMDEAVSRYATLPGTAEGKFVKKDFGYGLDNYISQGQVPVESEVAAVQRRWNDISFVVDTMVDAGALQLTGVTVKPKVEEKEPSRRGNSRRKAGARKDVKKVKPSKETYEFTFIARGSAIVKVLNDIASAGNFAVVESFSFHRHENDSLVKALAASGEKEKRGKARGRGRRGFEPVEEKEKKAEENPIVTDPLMDSPHEVKITVSTYVFQNSEGEVKK